MVSNWNLSKFLLKRYLISSVHTFIDPLPTLLNIAVEEDQGSEATNITDPQDSLCQYQGITGKQTGQMHTLILTELELLISLDILTGIGVTHIHHLDTNICITKLVILTIILVIHLILSLKHIRIDRFSTKPNYRPPIPAATTVNVKLHKIFDGTNKVEFATWAQSIENAVKLCNLDALSITLSKLQGASLKSANNLEGKETNSGRKLS